MTAILSVLASACLLPDRASANPLPSDALPQHVLDACDDRAAPFGHYPRAITGAAADLTALGVIAEDELRDVKIGFCGLKSVQGPVATTSCARNTILLDTNYANKDQDLVLKATLAHELKHYFQHKELKARFGEDYCFSDRYEADKAWMEAEADKFGDGVAELLFLGRPVEIKNECPVSVSVFLEPDRPKSAWGSQGFIDVKSGASALTSERATSKEFKFYAQSEFDHDRQWIWRGATMAHRRLIEGEFYGLKPVMLSSQSRSTGPFVLTLNCD